MLCLKGKTKCSPSAGVRRTFPLSTATVSVDPKHLSIPAGQLNHQTDNTEHWLLSYVSVNILQGRRDIIKLAVGAKTTC